MTRRVTDPEIRGADVASVLEFLRAPTPDLWFEQALEHTDELLIDHANCEKKAAGTALALMYRYVDRPELLKTLSRLAREELRHFEQVQSLLTARGIAGRHLSASRYAAGLRRDTASNEPERLVTVLLTGAIVEARSCERFLGLAEVLPGDLATFYRRLLVSEARHFRNYLALAERYATDSFAALLETLLARDAALAVEPDTVFRFHSGPLVA